MTRNHARAALTIFALAAALCIGEKANAQSFPPAWVNTSHYAPGDMVTDYGNVYRCLKAVTTPYLDPSKTYADWELNYVRNNTTVLIGNSEPFPTLQAAWTYCLNARVADGVYLHLNIVSANKSFTETFSAPFSLDHGSGAKISISGDNYGYISLDFSLSNGFVIDGSHSIASISGVTVNGHGYIGITATQGASISSMSNDVVSGFGTSFYASLGGSLNLDGSVVGQQLSYGCEADQLGSIFYGEGFELEGPGSNSGAVALYANHGGSIVGKSGYISGFQNGVQSVNGAIIDVTGCQISGCTIGDLAYDGGRINAANGSYGTKAEGGVANTTDLIAETAGTIEASGANYTTTSTGNNDGSYIFTASL